MRVGVVLLAVVPVTMLGVGAMKGVMFSGDMSQPVAATAKTVTATSTATATSTVSTTQQKTAGQTASSGNQPSKPTKSQTTQQTGTAVQAEVKPQALSAKGAKVKNHTSKPTAQGSSKHKTESGYSPRLSGSVSISPSNFGLNVAEWDNGMNASTTVSAVKRLGTTIQRYPNNDAWSWKLGRSRNGSDGYQSWNTYTNPFGMLQWAAELKQTGNTGIFNINYGMNSTWTGGQSITDVQELTRYILSHHIPVKAMIVGSENYFSTTINLRKNKSAQEYADVAKQMAMAIHQIDPQMQVGVNLSPGRNGQMLPNELNWDQTVLRTDAPYVQFVTFHSYPVESDSSNSDLLNQLERDIPATTTEIHKLLLQNAGKYASKLGVWFTEYNLFLQPRPQTVQSVGGSAALESALLLKSLGVQQVDWWSLHGGAHALLINGQVASSETHEAGVNYGTFALTGDGQAPEIGMNEFYPSATAISKLMALTSAGAQLQVQRAGSLFVGKVRKGNTVHWVLVNNGSAAQTVTVGSQSVTIAPTAYKIVTASARDVLKTPQRPGAWSSSALLTPGVLAAEESHSAPIAAPHVSSVSSTSIHSNQLLTVRGSGFGSSKGLGYVAFSNNGVNWGAPNNFYKLTIKTWSNSEIQFITPSASGANASVNLAPGTSAALTVHSNASLSSNKVTLHVQSALPATLSTTTLTPGQVVTVTGSGYGSSQGSGYVQFSDNGVNWGAPSNFYKLKIVSWKDNAVSFVVPSQNTTPGTTASIDVMSNSGIESRTVKGTVK